MRPTGLAVIKISFEAIDKGNVRLRALLLDSALLTSYLSFRILPSPKPERGKKEKNEKSKKEKKAKREER